MRLHKPGRLTSGPQTVAVPARNTGTLIPSRRGGLPTVPLKMVGSATQPYTSQHQTYTHPIRPQRFGK
jgi:hypothetical protein